MRFSSAAVLVFFLITSQNVLWGQEDLLRSGYENGSTSNVLYRTERMGKVYGTPRGFGFYSGMRNM